MSKNALASSLSPGERLLIAQSFKTVPMQLVKDCLVATRNNDKRERALSKRDMAFFVIAMALFSDSSQQDVFRHLEEGKRLLFGQDVEIKIPVKSSLVEARQRLGYPSMQELFKRAVQPIASPGQTPGAFFKGLRLVAIDGVLFDAPDTTVNSDHFGRSKSQYGKGAYPQVRTVALAECGTRVLLDYELSDETCRSEQALGAKLLARTKPGQLILADRLYCDGKLWRTVTDTGAHAIFRVKADTELPVERKLPDGSYMSVLTEGARTKSDSKQHPVRVIQFRLTTGKTKIDYRLITTLKPEDATPTEVAELYAERWKFETLAGEIKAVLNRRSDVLRSQTPELVKQELVGIFLAHYIVKSLMHEAAIVGDVEVERLSFKHSLSVVKRKVCQAGSFSP